MPVYSDLTKLNFCTYFDKNYLLKGIAMYRSLEKYLDNFTMWILCLDELTYNVLEKLKLHNVQLISLNEFENGDLNLLSAKNNRTFKEYCWTITPSLPLFIMRNHPQIESITYLDADLLFFRDPYPIYGEFEGKSILIIEHRYSPKYLHFLEQMGIYNVAMLVFRNDKKGLGCLNWWRERCNEWCYCRTEDGKFGDQKYLDDWPERFEGVLVLKNKGANLAPWNIENYSLSKTNGRVIVDEDDLIFFHYHSTFQLHDRIIEIPKGYKVTKQYIDLIYKPYAKSLHEVISEIKLLYPNFKYGISKINLFTFAKSLYSGKLCFSK